MAGEPLRVALLLCGHVHPDLVPEHGDYPELFADLLGPLGVEITTIDATGPLPDDPAAFDGWLVSGSADSAYDPLPWIPRSEELLRRIVQDEVPLVAICFGHQLLAQAMGGRVARSDAGWGAGAHDYEFVDVHQPWMTPPPEPGRPVRILASHQDQVVELPEGAEVIASTPHCPVAAYLLGPAALAIQPHPEFTPAVSRGLVERRRDRIGPETADAALASLDVPPDRELVAGWMAGFLRAAAARRATSAHQ